MIVKTLKIPIKLSGELEVRDSHEDTVIGGHRSHIKTQRKAGRRGL